MNDFDFLHELVDHARAWGIDDKFKTLDTGPHTLRLRDGDVELFIRWARHLMPDPVWVMASERTGLLQADGHLMRGGLVSVIVQVDRDLLRAARLHGFVTIGQMSTLDRTAVPV